MSRIQDYGITPGIMPTGNRNSITDVAGVSVGHCTIRSEGVNTGVTALIPQPGNLFRKKLTAAVEIINGFGKSVGLTQIAELGSLETPILLTNTFAVGTCTNALIRRAIGETPEIGRDAPTVNAVVCECNDGQLSDIQAMPVTEVHAEMALVSASADFEEGSVGAGTGMSCFGFKGGIGSASRIVTVDGMAFSLGALVLANFGCAGDLVLPDGRRPSPKEASVAEKGSIIVVLATDVPVDSKQLQRICRRAGAGIARLGSFWGSGSGDIAIGFTTANRMDINFPKEISELTRLCDTRMDDMFRAACETTQEAVLNALCTATAVTRPNGINRPLLSDWLRAHPVDFVSHAAD